MQSVYSEFRKIVVATPDAMAVQDGSRTMTYAQLDALADTIAAGFPSHNPAFVGIVMDHNVEMIASILAVLKTGAAYVPAEPSFPIGQMRLSDEYLCPRRTQGRRRRQEDCALSYRMCPGAEYHGDLSGNISLRKSLV